MNIKHRQSTPKILRRKIFLSACSTALTILLGGCAPKAQLQNSTFVVELGDDVYGNPYLYVRDPQNWSADAFVIEPRSTGITVQDNRYVTTSMDYLNVGEYDFVLIQGSTVTPFVIKVKDTQPPVSASSPERIQVQQNAVIDWQSVFQAADLSGVYYDAPNNTSSEVGEHTITVKIRDRFGNSTEKQIVVEVLP